VRVRFQGRGLACPALFFFGLRLAATVCLALCPRIAAGQPVEPKYLYTLSTFAGPVRDDFVRLHVDDERKETYVIFQNLVRVFNPAGMEVFSFGDGLDLGQILDAATDHDGNVIVLSHKDGGPMVTRCSFRGVPLGRIDVRNVPAGVTFAPSRLFVRDDAFYFPSFTAANVVVTDSAGVFRKQIELGSLIASNEGEKGGGAEVVGFTIDAEGNIFFSVPALFKVFKIPPDGKPSMFGSPGSAAGKFGVIAGLAVDRRGNIFVADKLKCAVIVFDEKFTFLREFGYRGTRPENLIVPDDLVIDASDRLYVSQGRQRGVSVFALVR
jgi:DNA-binding beta-propeller fold protein YncE